MSSLEQGNPWVTPSHYYDCALVQTPRLTQEQACLFYAQLSHATMQTNAAICSCWQLADTEVTFKLC